MHPSALDFGKRFFSVYCTDGGRKRVVDIGSQNVNGSLKDVCPDEIDYVGVDFMLGDGVDIVLDDPYKLPFPDQSIDAVVCSSVFEHSQFFWLLFLEILRVLKPKGLFYLNVPSNGYIHRYPVDCWRFYPDSGLALAAWAEHNGYAPELLESFVGEKQCISIEADAWNDFVAVFIKDKNLRDAYSQRIIYTLDNKYSNGYCNDGITNTNASLLTDDFSIIHSKSLEIITLSQVVIERDGQIASLNQAIIERDGQIASLNQAIIERDVQIASLNQVVIERDGQIASLNQAIIERDGQIASLAAKVSSSNERVSQLDMQLRDMHTRLIQILESNSWRITLPLREVKRWLAAPKLQIKRYVIASLRLGKRIYQWLPLGHQVKTTQRNMLARLCPKLLLLSGSPAATVTDLRKIKEAQAKYANVDFNTLRIDANNRAIDYCSNNQQRILVVIPSYNDHSVLEPCLNSINNAESKVAFRVLICDDNSPEPHKQWLAKAERQYTWLSVCYGNKNIGFAGNVNRGMSAASAGEHVVLLNSDTLVSDYWLDNLVLTATLKELDVVCGKLIYPNHGIQYYGGMRNPIESEWFMHNHHMEDFENLPTCFEQYTLYATGACMYISNHALTKLGLLDEQYGMAFEDVDYSLRAWLKNLKVGLAPFCIVTHLESVTRSRKQGPREINSKTYFWGKNANFFKRNVVSNKTGTPKVIYVTQDCGVGGGHRFIFQHIAALSKQKFDVELWTLGTKPNWYDLDKDVLIKTFGSYRELVKELAKENAIKVATWWETAEHVWLASIVNGTPVYYVQDIESSYYIKRGELLTAAKVDSMYVPEFKYLTYANWIKDKLASDFKRPAECVGFYLDQNKFYRDKSIKKKRQILVFARGEPLKNFAYTKEILSEFQTLDDRFAVVAVGIDDSLIKDMDGCVFVRTPNDQELNKIYNESIAIIQTSTHEGLSLPPLEGMLCECLVFCTDAFGNRAYIEPDVNCVLLPANNVAHAASIIANVLADSEIEIKNKIISNALNTAMKYNAPEFETRLSKFYWDVASKEYGVYL